MYLEGDVALDLFSWINRELTLLYWEELVKKHCKKIMVLQSFKIPTRTFVTFNKWVLYCGIIKNLQKHWSRVINWLDHCLLGVSLNGLKEELKSDVRITNLELL